MRSKSCCGLNSLNPESKDGGLPRTPFVQPCNPPLLKEIKMHRYLFLRWFFLSVIAAAGILLFWVWCLGVFGSLPAPPELPFGWAASHPLLCSRWLDPLLLIWVWALLWKGLDASRNPANRAEVVSAVVVSVVGGICLLVLPARFGILI